MTYPEREALLPEDMSQICTMVKERAGPHEWGDWLSVPLRHSIDNLNIELFTKILDAGADLDEGGSIHVAVGEGKDEFLSILVARGADVNATDLNGKTPLILALCDGRVTQNARTLLAAGARVDIRDAGRMSALDYVAALIGDVAIVQAIVDRGVDVNEIGFEGQSALHHASAGGFVDVVDVLVTAGANIDLADEIGATPLHVAADGEANIDTVLYLLRHGASPTNVTDPGGLSILHNVCYVKYEGMYGVVDLLFLRWGADETAEDNDGKTPEMMLNENLPKHRATAEEIERTRLLLSRAPADRVWRRRGWLVMLRKRSGTEEGTVTNTGSSLERDGHKVARKEGGVRPLGEQDESGVAGPLGGVVGWLLTAPEGVFRSVVGFI